MSLFNGKGLFQEETTKLDKENFRTTQAASSPISRAKEDACGSCHSSCVEQDSIRLIKLKLSTKYLKGFWKRN